jgi:putative oxygen-independent coproporphyrinogen III oxidase
LTASAPPLGVYIHWPYCARICPYCDFNVVRARGRTDEEAALVDAIAADMVAQAAMIGPRTLVSIFFGGGTPSLMAPDAVARLIETARRLWPGDGPVEIALEANPTDAEADRFAGFRDAGIARLSLGVQAFDDDALTFLGRAHDGAETLRAVETAARTFPRLSLDLIYALPGQDADGWSQTLRRAATLGAEHISPYQLTIEAGTPFDRAVRRGRFTPANEDLGAALYETTQTTLEALGFQAYEVSNHARGPAARARHNLVYWRGEDYVGVGPGAHGRLTRPESVRLSSEAEPRIPAYIARVRDTGTGANFTEMSALDRAEERTLMGLRTDEGVALAELAPLPLNALPELIDSQHLRLSEGHLIATPAGRLVLDHLTRCLILG